jgi:hypothetical protein
MTTVQVKDLKVGQRIQVILEVEVVEVNKPVEPVLARTLDGWDLLIREADDPVIELLTDPEPGVGAMVEVDGKRFIHLGWYDTQRWARMDVRDVYVTWSAVCSLGVPETLVEAMEIGSNQRAKKERS